MFPILLTNCQQRPQVLYLPFHRLHSLCNVVRRQHSPRKPRRGAGRLSTSPDTPIVNIHRIIRMLLSSGEQTTEFDLSVCSCVGPMCVWVHACMRACVRAYLYINACLTSASSSTILCMFDHLVTFQMVRILEFIRTSLLRSHMGLGKSELNEVIVLYWH